MHRAFVFAAMFCISLSAKAQQADTLSTGERRNSQNVLLNASAESQPRIISLGIPQWGGAILEDGLPTSMFNDFFPGFWSWRSGLGTETLELTRLDESALQLGQTGFYPMSVSRVGSGRPEGAVTYTVNHYGRHQIDLNYATPLGRGWGLDLNVYQDLNRGSNHLDLTYLQEHIQYYKAGLSKQFSDGSGRFFSTYVYTKKLNLSDPYGPFVFVGDGSVRPYGDFVLGHDQYLPATAVFDYVDIADGQLKSRRFVEDGGIPIHILTAGLERNFSSGITFTLNSRLRLSHCDLTEAMLGSIENAALQSGYTYADGTPYDGKVQTRYMFYHQDDCDEWFTTATLKGRKGNFEWLSGANVWFNRSVVHMMTTNFAYEAQKNPAALYYGGNLFYVPNTGAQFLEGGQGRYALFGQGQWTPVPHLSVRAGLRLEYSRIHGEGAYNLDGKENNTRMEGWSLMAPGVTRTPFSQNDFNGAATLVALYRFNPSWGLELDAIATRQHAELWQYGEASLPSDLPKDNFLVRGGFSFKNGWLDLQSMLSYYRQNNNYYSDLWTHELTEPGGGYPAGYNESIYVGSLYSMVVLGWTTDALISEGDFQFHGLLTLRSPRYSDYRFQPRFSDGYSESFDFSGKYITGSPAVEMELEPSYSPGKWRFWATARYYSRQYVNITNSLYFKARWETFAGIDLALNDKVRFGVNVVNFLNQTGASAGIQAASLAVAPTPFKDYLTSGTYIRPFTLEFSTSLKF